MNERVVCFGAEGTLFGIFTEPDLTTNTNPRPGFILLNSGVVHRVGPNRLYVKTARRLAASGYPVLRFDLSGIGDSSARTDTLAFEKSAVTETTEAMEFLKEEMEIKQFILAGICSGADISFLTAKERPEVIGAVLINGQSLHGVTDNTGDEIVDEMKQGANARYLLKSALFNPESWKKLFSGKANYQQLAGIMMQQVMKRISPGKKALPPAAKGLQDGFHALLERDTRLLLVYSEGDPGLDYLKIMFGDQLGALTAHKNVRKTLIDGADHTFTPLQSQDQLIEVIRDWANKIDAMT